MSNPCGGPDPLAAPLCCAVPATRVRDPRELARLHRALADETRLRILALLADGEVCVCHVQAALRLPQPTISRHLAYLRRAGLVWARRDGVWMHYRLASLLSPVIDHVLASTLHALTHAASTPGDAARLRRERIVGDSPSA
ncbi:MAG: ArsR/SmtB family transcription factor [Acidobacteriota bacterium]